MPQRRRYGHLLFREIGQERLEGIIVELPDDKALNAHPIVSFGDNRHLSSRSGIDFLD